MDLTDGALLLPLADDDEADGSVGLRFSSSIALAISFSISSSALDGAARPASSLPRS